ncbi:hypothetical protein PYW07_010423 [Mythimna separata]|uniref:Uncharacterized protein n=1 Tax=Mythimna separata TaxID=271217 RepID=A0AAD8DLP0_MYTSE|nr:hypothetical protein PYW07_010423 [Mythimna separata]
MIKERKDTLAKQQAEEKLIADTWDSLAGQGLADELRKEQLAKQRRAETEVCNQKMLSMKKDKLARQAADEAEIQELGQRTRDAADMKRCQYLKKRKQANKECHDAVYEQIKENEATRQKKMAEKDKDDLYQSQLSKQLEQLVAHKEMTEAQARKLHQKNLLQQMQYNQLLKGSYLIKRSKQLEQLVAHKEMTEAQARKLHQKNLLQQMQYNQLLKLVAHKELTEAQARKLHQKNLLQQMQYNQLLKDRVTQEELDQRKKSKVEADSYQRDIVRIMSRSGFSDEVHPFAKPMLRGMKIPERCPCSKTPDYCAVPVRRPKEAPGKDPKGGPGKDPKGGPGKDPRGAPGKDPKGGPGKDPKETPGKDPRGAPGKDPKGAPGKDPTKPK